MLRSQVRTNGKGLHLKALVKWLAVLPAVAVFALLAGALRADPQATPAAPAPVVTGSDAWAVPLTTPREPPPGLVALKELPQKQTPMSEADYRSKVDRKDNMPATKAPVVFFAEAYDEYLRGIADKNRLRITRFWHPRTIDAKAAARLVEQAAYPLRACVEHTWAYGREHTVTFALDAKRVATKMATDGSPALTECLTQRFTNPMTFGPPPAKGQSLELVLSFVAVQG